MDEFIGLRQYILKVAKSNLAGRRNTIGISTSGLPVALVSIRDWSGCAASTKARPATSLSSNMFGSGLIESRGIFFNSSIQSGGLGRTHLDGDFSPYLTLFKMANGGGDFAQGVGAIDPGDNFARF
jgi:hypothetical protein